MQAYALIGILMRPQETHYFRHLQITGISRMSASAHRHDRSTRKRWQATSAIPLWTQSDLRRGSRRQADLNQSLYRTVLRRSVSRRLIPERLWLGIGLTVIGCS